ncbi:endonuclease/exonuclease/phosphatase family metal-dependent hydrolase [Geothermobacter ehrlichii]|uniref:Endonuclease/exonuclease/phosphatase family metal-dependent hydrolase n=1 Tax=Geothermobacter ehrlichii TaxID=213224 RepID=A0A5D3WIH2_9BACT|nr:endonuclease/exonuclease/phosphatase family protein [Geothermobacter ehrlichii]TYO97677.1 endonuclease/exonuclease/phosphatase family metal-dependent hydrolase [Geothermobacter ehrlichii]
MPAIRVMTYQVNGCRGSDGRVDLERVLDVIHDAAPDLVALQRFDAPDAKAVERLAERLGMSWFGDAGGNVILSCYPLSGLRPYDLGGEGCCLRADVDILGRRLHLFNVCLSSHPRIRQEQIGRLLGPDLLGHADLACPLIVLGDFADCGWGLGNLNLALVLRRARRPLWCGTYPARFPLLGRDRAYLRGEVRVLESSIPRWGVARHASTHLPLVLTLQARDPREYLRTKSLSRRRMEIAPG